MDATHDDAPAGFLADFTFTPRQLTVGAPTRPACAHRRRIELLGDTAVCIDCEAVFEYANDVELLLEVPAHLRTAGGGR